MSAGALYLEMGLEGYRVEDTRTRGHLAGGRWGQRALCGVLVVQERWRSGSKSCTPSSVARWRRVSRRTSDGKTGSGVAG